MESDTPTLTAHDVRALRHADSIAFDRTREGAFQIRAILRAEMSPSGFEQTHTITVSGSLDNYGPPVGEDWTGFHLIHSGQYDREWLTMRKSMRAGRAVMLRWVRDNNNDLFRDAGFHADELHIRIGTPDKRDAQDFLVTVAVRHDNSARMVRA